MPVLDAVAVFIAVWVVLAIAAGLLIGSFIHSEDRLFGYLVPSNHREKLFGFDVPLDVRRR
jgi:hypothetical protein